MLERKFEQCLEDFLLHEPRILYGTNINAILRDERSVNLGAVYESVVAQELHAHGFTLHYYDNKQKGEVDYLIDDFQHLTVLPLEIKSGKDYTMHSALDKFLETLEYHIHEAVVFSNEQMVFKEKGIVYLPIYYCMFLQNDKVKDADSLVIPNVELPME